MLNLRARIAGTLAALWTVVAIASAQTELPRPGDLETNETTGTVVTSTANSLVIRTDLGDSITFLVDDASTMPSRLTVGDFVNVRYEETPIRNEYHALAVSEVVRPSAVEPRATASESAVPDELPTTGNGAGAIGVAGVLALAAALWIGFHRRLARSA